MRPTELQSVVLTRGLPEHGLEAGDLAAVVHVHADGAVEAEFVMVAGTTQALVTLAPTDYRAVEPTDLIAVRKLDRSA